MKAVIYNRYGSPDVLKPVSMEEPDPGDHEVLVKVHSTTVTPMDWKFRSGKIPMARLMSGIIRPGNPVLGMELSGEITRLGSKVRSLQIGDWIFAATKGGGYASYVCLPESQVLKKPGPMTLEEAATVPFGSVTAYHFLVRAGRIRSGQRVLINGASGGVGIFAVQLARYFGANVTAVCSGGNAEMVTMLGAHRVIDYTAEVFTSADGTFDIIFDVAGCSSFGKCRRLLSPGGIYMTTILSPRILVQMVLTTIIGRKRARFTIPSFPPVKDLEIVRNIIEEKKLRTVIDRRYGIEEIASAHRYAEKGHVKGKIVVNH